MIYISIFAGKHKLGEEAVPYESPPPNLGSGSVWIQHEVRHGERFLALLKMTFERSYRTEPLLKFDRRDRDRVLVDSRPFPDRSFCHYSPSRAIGKLYDVKRDEIAKHV
jgi:hypothetical protein